MNSSLVLFLAFFAVIPALPAQQVGIDQDSEVFIVPAGDKFLRWQGHPGRTYFMQISSQAEPLARWTWAPYIDLGSGVEISHEIGGTAAKAFFRLAHTDLPKPPGVTLNEWDIDGDNRSNQEEIGYYFPSNPLLADTDGDDLDDGEEVNLYYSDPALSDSDGDGLDDYEEAVIHGTYPWTEDSDWDGVDDFAEITIHFSNPLHADTDNDGMPDGWEASHDLDLLSNDTLLDPDGDGLDNLRENLLRLNPGHADSDGDGVADGNEDNDKDELTNLQEINVHLTDAKLWDTDSDGMPDGWEVRFGLDATSSTGDDGTAGDREGDEGDGLSNFDEWLHGTDPNLADSDNDNVGDFTEVANGSDPVDGGDQGAPPPPAAMRDLSFTVGDPSVSHSEKWLMKITGMGPEDTRTLRLASPDFGQSASRTFKLRKWNRYEITVEHQTTDPEHLEQNEGKPDYDWEAKVDGLPGTDSSEHTAESPGANNFFAAGKYWLVDNRKAVLTSLRHGDDDDLVSGKKAYLVPVEVRDNLLATGVDDVSVTDNENAGGYQQDFWIMAPPGVIPPGLGAASGSDCSNDMHFLVPLDPLAALKIEPAKSTADPGTTPLSTADPGPIVTWKGNAAETVEDSPVWRVGADEDVVDLPVRVKTMKRRTVNVAIYPVKFDVGNREVPLINAALLTQCLNQAFGYQLNAWINITYKPTTVFDYEEDIILDDLTLENFAIANSAAMTVMRNDAAYEDANQHIRVLLIDLVEFRDLNAFDPRLNGVAYYQKNLAIVNVGYPDGTGPPPEALFDTIAHEVGHLITKSDHPDEGLGVAPLPGTVRTHRLLCSYPNRAIGAKLLVKSEWDSAEEWLKRFVDGIDP